MTAEEKTAVVLPQKQDADAKAPAKPKARKAVLPWMHVPVAVAPDEAIRLCDVRGLDKHLAAAMEAEGFPSLFPVQAAAWHVLGGGMSARHDLCIAAPTGSGKTLAYALPLLQRCVSRRAFRGCRVLVVLPTRALAQQVFSVIAALARHLPGVAVGLANGMRTEREEAAMLASGSLPAIVPSLLGLLPTVQALQGAAAGAVSYNPSARQSLHEAAPGEGLGGGRGDGWGAAAVHVLVATPGRLVHHLQSGGSRWLRHLEMLVVDETDRLLRQDYQGWLPKLLAAMPRAQPVATGASKRVVKLIVSATLTHDPAKVAKLQLHAPRYVALQGKSPGMQLPATLREFQVVTAAAQKPCALVALLRELAGERAIVFTGSVDATHRLALLLAACEPALGLSVGEYSSARSALEQRTVLERFKAGQLRVLVASDGMTRGMDVPGVDLIVNYDMPVHSRTYVHRAGRTARAGLAGSVYTLLRSEHVGPFKSMLRKAGNKSVQDHHIGVEAWEAVREHVAGALQTMQHALLEEA